MGTVPAPNIPQDALEIAQAPGNAMASDARLREMAAQTDIARQQATGVALQNQQQQQALNDQKAMTAAMQAWDGSDYNDLPGLVLKHGGSANAVFNLRNQVIAQKTALTKLTTDQLSNRSQQNDAALGLLASLHDVDDENLNQHFHAAAHDLIQQGLMDPQHAGMIDQLASLSPAEARLHLGIIEKGLQGEKEQFDQEQKDRENTTKEITAKAEQTKATTGQWEKFPELGVLLNTATGEQKSVSGGALMPAGMMESKYVALQQRANQGIPLDPSDAAWKKAYERYKTLVPQFQINMATTGGGLGPGAGGGGGNGTVTPAANGATPQTPKKAAPGGWQSDNGHTLNDVPQQIRAEVQQVLEYRRADPSITQRGPVGQAINAWVAELDPQHDATTFGARNAILRQYAKDANTGELGAINTSLGHLGDLYDASKGLSQQSLPILHNIASRVGAAVGSDAETTYMNILHKVGPELTKAYLASGGSVGERGSTEDDFGLNKGIKQIQSNIFESANLLNSKLASKRNDWEKTFIPYRDQDHFDARWVTPEARDMLQNLGSQSPIVKGKQGNQGNQTAQKLVSLSAARALPQNKGKSDDEIRTDIQSHGYKVKED